MKILNPYNDGGKWLTGSMHNHTTNSACGRFPVDTVYDIYSRFDFFSISDHDKVTPIQKSPNDNIIFRAIEVSSNDAHMLLVNPPLDIMSGYSNTFTIENYQKLSDICIKNNGVSVLCHPNRFHSQHWNLKDMLKMNNYTGVEIISGCRDIVEEDIAFDKWDAILSSGKKVWGFGNDDFHVFGQCRNVWNVVLAEEKSETAILDALKKGSFYVSTGFGFDEIRTESNKIIIKLKNNDLLKKTYKYVTLFGKDGRVLYEKTGRFNELEYECKGDEGYVRVNAYIEGGYGAFSQPLFIEN